VGRSYQLSAISYQPSAIRGRSARGEAYLRDGLILF
jgi:hypothetical protein